MKCFNCDEQKEGIKYFKYCDKLYCYDCIKTYFFDERAEDYFDDFLYEECEEKQKRGNANGF